MEVNKMKNKIYGINKVISDANKMSTQSIQILALKILNGSE